MNDSECMLISASTSGFPSSPSISAAFSLTCSQADLDRSSLTTTLALEILTYNFVHIPEMSSYTWDIFSKAWHFKFPAFGLDRLLQIPKSYGVSFGFWLRVNSEEVESQVTSTAMVCTRATFMQTPVENAEFWDSERLPSIILP